MENYNPLVVENKWQTFFEKKSNIQDQKKFR